MKRALLLLLAMVSFAAALPAQADDLAKNFASPPAAARPWVYWFPLNGNLSKEGITADLEAMARVGIGGVLYMEVDQGAPRGPADFAGPLWRELLTHAGREANRLGLEINMNNDAGWCGSGGPWITPELSMQKVVWTETTVEGPQTIDVALAKPAAEHGFYRDIAVLAMPAPAGNFRTAQGQWKALTAPQHFPPQPAKFADAPADSIIARDRIIDVTAHMAADGKLSWKAPAGKWLVLRFGHTTTGKDNHPAPETGRGLECDKFSTAAAQAHYRGLISKLVADYGPLTGKTLVSIHIDSWETGSQNWTPLMRDEFKKRRGYDLWPWLPAFAGYVVDSNEVTERFLWDLRQTISDLIVENYAGEFQRLAHKDGLRLSIEAYDGVPCDEMTYAGRADEPMAEFWKVGASTEYSCTEMSSAAHTYGKPILGAEAFTSTNVEKWLEYPGSIKGLGDWAFCEGINRFVFHRYAAQPWTNVAPGMSMGPWGLHYERTQTWWDQSKAWHQYLARCQYLLQQGLFVADVLYLQPEGAPRRFVPPSSVRGGYNFDGCTPEVLLTRAEVKNGRIVLPDGMSYRVLVLPDVETMTPGLLQKINQLVEAGAVVFAAGSPKKAPGLTGYPQCDSDVQALADDLWSNGKLHAWKDNSGEAGGPAAPATISNSARWIWLDEGQRQVEVPPGRQMFRREFEIAAGDPVKAAKLVLTADNSFECSVNGRPIGVGGNFHQVFVFDVTTALQAGKNKVEVVATNGGVGPNPAGMIGTLWMRLRSGKQLDLSTNKSWQAAAKNGDAWTPARELGSMGMEPWGSVNAPPAGAVLYPHASVVNEWLATNGVPADFQSTPRLSFIHRKIGDAEVYFIANPENRDIAAMAEFRISGKRPEFWWPDSGHTSPALAFAEHNGTTRVPITLEPNGSVFVVFRQEAAGIDAIASITRNGQELLGESSAVLGGKNIALPVDVAQQKFVESGKYAVRLASGKTREIDVELPAPLKIDGPWQVAFDTKRGGPGNISFDRLEDWSQRPEDGIKYYSGTATYHTTFQSPQGTGSQKLELDLGRVEVIADVTLNGKPIGTAWKQPYRLDVTAAIVPGENQLEVKVANLWVNRQIGDELLPEDSDRNANGTLKSWPTWLAAGEASPTGRYTFTSWRLWKKEDSLTRSGLLGPVTIRAVKPLSND